MKKQTLYKLLRIVFSIALISFVLSMTNLVELIAVLKSVNVWWIVVALLLEFLRVLICSCRWRVLLSAKGIRSSLGSLVSFYFVGNFFNMLLPTALGGDAMRAYKSANYTGKTADSITSVLVERILDFVALFVICWISLAISGLEWLKGTDTLLIVSCLSGALLLLLVLMFNRRLMQKITSLGRLIKWWDAEARLKAFFNSLHELLHYKRSLGIAFGISLIYQFAGIVSPFLLSLALDLKVPFSFFLVVMPVICVITMIPISIGGLGVREGAFVFFFAQQGITTESALALSLLYLGLNLALALVGGIIYGVGKYPR